MLGCPAVPRALPLHSRILFGMAAGAVCGIAAHLLFGDAPGLFTLVLSGVSVLIGVVLANVVRPGEGIESGTRAEQRSPA